MKNNQHGFTLIEMMIVLLVISVLLIITIPNITKHNSTINSKGCKAFVKMVEAQVQAFEMDKNKLPSSLEELQKEKYINQTTCPNGDKVEIGAKGEVNVIGETPSAAP
ncbi:competence type IV pilus major pilin ComGC [Robertmurraya andreesenii]|uniref:ComG operon protein 3 n=1 Tax=Anoxybacillus andreesenii TaxID=1325932 RepID=A0ABT9V638_9BACL|nr:competence type IV pilus major pilin ComGC [Robertmurraya andreesenii]MDQ0156402.1 prepilin-type N-terminal cleavage/methylation domain-containing protein [Robertmurraya andreesenii]